MIGSGDELPRLPSALLRDRYRRAILAADISGYTRLMSLYEDETHHRFMRLRVNIIQPLIVRFRGNIVKNTGDGFIAYFESCIDAVDCAVALQRELAAAEASISKEARITFRMGLNYGEVFIEPDDIFGHAVNVAARMHDLAPSGGIVLSGALHEEVGARLGVAVEDLGHRSLKNIPSPVHAYSLRLRNERSAENLPGRVDASQPVRPPSIAVLPFRDLNETGGASRFGDGVLEEIVASLATLRELLVISPTSTLRYRYTTPDIATIAQDLGVRYVISGSRQTAGARLRMMVQLNDAENTNVLWSGRYEGEVDQIFDLQDQITMDVVGRVAPQIREVELKRALSKRPDSMDGYDYFLQGVELLRGMSTNEFARARLRFQDAIEADANYAPSYAYAAFWHVRNIAQGWSTDRAHDARLAWELSASAIERDRNNALALAARAHSRSFLAHDYEEAIPLFDRALARSPNHALVLSFSSLTRSYVGDAALALEQAGQSVRLSPHDMYSFWLYMVLSVAHYADGNYAESVVWSRRAMRENLHFAANLRMLAAGLSALGNREEASQFARVLMQMDPTFCVSEYEKLCPWRSVDVRARFLERLRLAGLPE